MDYIEKNLLKRLSNYEDVSLFAALIMKIKYWGKILRSKDNSLSKELVIKNIDYALPATFLREKPQDYWVTKIQRDFDKNNLKELSIEEAQEKFLNFFSQYTLSYSSYYVLRASDGQGETNNNVNQFSSGKLGGNIESEGDMDDDIVSEGGSRLGEGNKETFLA